MRVHETMAETRLRFAQRLNEMSEELATIVKEVDKNRKQVRRFQSQVSVDHNVQIRPCRDRPKTSPRDTRELCKSQKRRRRSSRTGLN